MNGAIELLGGRLIKLRGLHPRENPEKDYDTSKKPPEGLPWQYVTPEQKEAWVKAGGHAGWVVSDGKVVVDIDDAASGERLFLTLKRMGIKFICIKTPRGYQFIFSDTGAVKTQLAGALTAGGFLADYRLAGKGYIVLPSENTEGRSIIHSDDEHLDPMPKVFIPVKRFDQVQDAEKLLPVPVYKGGRDDLLYRSVCRLRTLNGTYRLDLTPEDIEGITSFMNFAFFEPPLSDFEVRQKIKSAEKHEVEVKPVTPKQAAPSMTLTSLSDLYDEPEVEVEYIVDEMLPTGGLSASVAKPKVGKSTMARQLALTVSTGTPFLGRFTKQGAVLYYALEEKRSEVKRHFQDMGATGSEPIFIYAGGAGPDAHILMEEAIKNIQPVLVIVDPLFRLIKVKDGNDYATMSAALDPVLRLARDLGTHIHVVHHAPKGEKEDAGESPLGSTAIFGSIDTLMILKRHPAEGYRTLQTIQRYGEDIPETLLKFDPVSRTTILGRSKGEEDMEGVRARILSHLSEQKNPVGESVIEADVPGRTALKRKALRELVSSGQIERHGKGGRKDPFTYSCSLVPDVPAVPDVPRKESHGNKSIEGEPIQSSCFDVPAYGKNIRNNKHEKSQDNKNIEESSCSHIPAISSCSREFEDSEIMEVLE